MNPDDLTPPQFKRDKEQEDRENTVKMVRGKLDALYGHEPSAAQEAKEVKQLVHDHEKLSKHQRFMKDLTNSGKNAEQIQTEWHEYYQSLSEAEKHQVWQEFYAEQEKINKQKKEVSLAKEFEKQKVKETEKKPITSRARAQHFDSTKPKQNYSNINHDLIEPPAKKAIKKAKKHLGIVGNNPHIKSLIFGLSMGFMVILTLLFSFFNERFVVPFIRPNTHVSATPIIVDPNISSPVGPESKIIVPKINVEAPLVFDVQTVEEKAVQAGLERGVVHYGTTSNPGEKGNSVIFGHSSGNILNKGKYKFAFILLKSLENGDTFIVQHAGKRYVYKVYNKYVTNPKDVSVLQAPSDKVAITTLITCDPPGTSTNRLIIQAEQIFPSPSQNTASSVSADIVSQPSQLPSNSESLWHRLFN